MRPILVLAWNKKICTAVKVCTAIKIVLVLVCGSYYVPDTYVPGTSERRQGDSASLVKPTQDTQQPRGCA